MSTRRLTQCAVLAAILYIVYFIGSFVAYFELVSFTILLYGTTLPKKMSWFSVIVFCILVMLTKGIAPWSVMYLLVLPQYVLIYNALSRCTKSEYIYALVGTILSFIMGTLIDLPYLLIAGLGAKSLWITLLLGFQVSIGNAICTLIATLFLYRSISKILKRIVME